jgi:hypothetical protein
MLGSVLAALATFSAAIVADSPVPGFSSNLPVVVIDTHAIPIPEGDMTMCVPPKPPFVGNDTVALTLTFSESCPCRTASHTYATRKQAHNAVSTHAKHAADAGIGR